MNNEQIVEKILNSKNYKAVYPKTVERVVEEALRKNPDYAVNTVKNDLHRIWGAYYSRRPRFAKLLKKLKGEDMVLDLLKIHSSTAERIPHLNQFYKRIFEITGKPSTVIDIACGFNPLTIPWMELGKDTKYIAYDIDVEEIDFLNKASKALNITPQPECRVGDVFVDSFPNADVIFLFKLIPLIEQQKKGCTLAVLQKLNARFIVITFPLKTLSGREVGMSEFYSREFEDIIKDNEFEKIEFPNELVYVINNS